MKKIHKAFGCFTLCGRYLAQSRSYEYVYPKSYKKATCKACLKLEKP